VSKQTACGSAGKRAAADHTNFARGYYEKALELNDAGEQHDHPHVDPASQKSEGRRQGPLPTTLSAATEGMPEGERLTGGGDPFVLVWDWQTAKVRRKIGLPPGRTIGSMNVSPDGKRAEIILWGERALRFFDLGTGRELLSPGEGHFGPAWGLAIGSDGKLVSAGTDNTIRVWDLLSGKQLQRHRTEHPVGVMSLALSADGRLVATAEINKGSVEVHERDTGRLARTIEDGRSISEVKFAPIGNLLAVSGDRVAAGAGRSQRFLAYYDASTGRKFHSEDLSLSNPAFSPEGRFLAGTSGNEILLLEVATGQLWERLTVENPFSLAYSPDGRTLAWGIENAIVLWELASGKERCRIQLPSKLVRLCQYSSNGRLLAASNAINDDRAAIKIIQRDLNDEDAQVAISLIPGEPADFNAPYASLQSDVLLNNIRDYRNLPRMKDLLAASEAASDHAAIWAEIDI